MPRVPAKPKVRAMLLAALLWSVAAVLAPAGAQVEADDPVYAGGLQWGLERIGAEEAWARATGDGVTIAVVDSGVDLSHEDLKDQLAGNVSCIGANGNPDSCRGSGQDDNGHGSHVSGIAVAATGNGRGMAGVAPDARLLAVRALRNDCDSSGCSASGTAADVSAGIRWAVRHGADVINLSLGGGALQAVGSCGFCAAIEEAWQAGVLVVVAAGNDALLPSGFGDEHAVVVTATTRDDRRASYSSASSGLLRRARWPVSAPGGEAEADPADCAIGGSPRGILSSYWTEDSTGSAYACLAGTSMAAPHVAGALAVLLSADHTPQQAVDRLIGTAKDLGPAGRDDTFGYGLIDLARAVGPAPLTTTTTEPTTTTSVAPPTSVTGAAETTVPPTTVAPTTTTEPPVAPPDTSAAAPFAPAPPVDAGPQRPPGWLVTIAVVAILISGGGAVAMASNIE